jgi:isopentenyldiphosphate isomerase
MDPHQIEREVVGSKDNGAAAAAARFRRSAPRDGGAQHAGKVLTIDLISNRAQIEMLTDGLEARAAEALGGDFDAGGADEFAQGVGGLAAGLAEVGGECAQDLLCGELEAWVKAKLEGATGMNFGAHGDGVGAVERNVDLAAREEPQGRGQVVQCGGHENTVARSCAPAPVSSAMSDREYLPICNGTGRVIGIADRAVIHAQGLLHQAVHILIFDGQGRLFLQRRGEDKDCEPGVWAVSVGGHVEQGESPMQTAVRELGEELGLEGTPEMLGALPPDAKNGWEFVTAFTLMTRETPRWDGVEITDGKWVTLEEVERHLREGDLPLAASFEATYRLWRGKHAAAA